MKEEVDRLIQKADHAFEVAVKLIDNGFPSDAASKLYYAMFYSTQALLIADDIEVIKHSAVESAFGYHYAKTGKINPKFHKMLINARKIREIADYDLHEEISEQISITKLIECKEFITTIKEYINYEQ